MKLSQLIGVRDETGSVIIYAVGRNKIELIGSSLETTVKPGTGSLQAIPFKAPIPGNSHLVAISIEELDHKGDHLSWHNDFVRFWCNAEDENVIEWEIDKTFVPFPGRMTHLEHNRIVTKIGNQVVSSHQSETAIQVDPNMICKWMTFQFTDEELLASTIKESEIDELRKKAEGLKAQNEMLDKWSQDKALERALLEEENERLKQEVTTTKNQLEVAKVAINEIFNEMQSCWFIPEKLRKCIRKCRAHKYLWPDL